MKQPNSSERTKAITTSFYRAYKIVLIGFSLMTGLLYFLYFIVSVGFVSVYLAIPIGLTVLIIAKFRWYPEFIRSFEKYKDISYDSENLYIIEGGIEEQIPFYQVKDVEILTLNGVYQFNFFNKALHDGFVKCKTSMWYPLNFMRVDGELNRVRSLIRKAQWSYKEQLSFNHALPSNSL